MKRGQETRHSGKRGGGLFCVLMMAAMVSATGAEATVSIPEMMQFLEEQGLPAGTTSAVEGAIIGMVRAMDPGARICTPEEATAIRAQWTGLDEGSASGGGTSRSVAVFESWPEGLSYLKIKGLNVNGGQEIMAHLRTLAEGAGVIMDLRGTDGNDLDTVVALASPFYGPAEALFRIENRTGALIELRTATEQDPLRTPLMVLIDRDTRGAAETLVSLWSGKTRIMLIGEPTRGDSCIRELLPLPDGRFLYVATKRIVPVRAGIPEAKGVQPDVAVEARGGSPTPLVHVPGYGRPLSAKSTEDRDLMMRVDGDPVLRRGTDILLALRALKRP
jgi:hypothetical protein